MPESMKVEVKGLEELLRKFDASKGVVKRESHDAMEKSTAVIWRDSSSYTQHDPPQRPGQTYVRTFTMARTMSHKVKSYAGGVKGYIRGGVYYAPYVRGSEMQAWMHAGRWRTLKKIAEQHMSEIEGFFSKAMERLAKFLGD